MLYINLMTPELRQSLYYRRWYQQNRAKRRASSRAWDQANPEKVRAYRRATEQKGETRQKHKKWRKANPEKVRATVLAWKKANPEKVREIQRAAWHRRDARLRGNGGSWTAEQWQTLKRQYGHRCVGCWKTQAQLKALGRKLVPDHIVPLTKGGMNDITNIQPLCHGRGGCNNRKGPKYTDFVIS